MKYKVSLAFPAQIEMNISAKNEDEARRVALATITRLNISAMLRLGLDDLVGVSVDCAEDKEGQ